MNSLCSGILLQITTRAPHSSVQPKLAVSADCQFLHFCEMGDIYQILFVLYLLTLLD